VTPRGDIRDIKHVVILMQENRSFDHYFGSLRGVRGFADRATILLPGGLPVWQQPDTAPGQPAGGTRYPWPRSAGTFTGAFDFANAVYGPPDLPFVTAPSGGARAYHPAPAGDVMPVQEPGAKRARPLLCQPGASLAGFTAADGAVTARLAFGNNAPFVSRASHFAVYDNLATARHSRTTRPVSRPVHDRGLGQR
jgi:Phosphoesterase family